MVEVVFENKEEVHIRHTGSKYGPKIILIDAEVYYKLIEEIGSLSLWSSKRHNGIYVMMKQGKRLHRAVMEANSKEIVDHISGDCLDNRKSNLRITNSLGNNCNSSKRKKGKSRFKGVSPNPYGKWIAQIQFNKVKYSLGTYASEEEARDVYINKAKELHGEYMSIRVEGKESKTWSK